LKGNKMKLSPFKIRLLVAFAVFILTIFAFFGTLKYYPVNFANIQFVPLMQRLLTDFSITALALFSGLIVLTLVFGRFYCSIICPFGILQELLSLIVKPKNNCSKSFPVKYFIAALVFGALIGGSALFIRYIDPYTIFGSAVTLSIFGLIAALAVLAIVFFKNRFFCSNICPVGAVLGLISKISFLKVDIDKEKCLSCGLCSKNCPTGSINHKEKIVNNETCIKCLKCLDICKKDAIKYKKSTKNIPFSPNRRTLILAGSALLVFGGAIKTGFEISKNFIAKIKGIILPPGAINENRTANKCLNCNLCLNNCPTGILTRADSKFPVVHIDYTKGEKHCKFNCKKCSEVCPSGAIKKMTLDEKQRTRIAMAYIDPEKCDSCGICRVKCPVSAIFKDSNGKSAVDGSKCIGCGLCAAHCPNQAIEIFSIKEQKLI